MGLNSQVPLHNQELVEAPQRLEQIAPDRESSPDIGTNGPYVVVLYNDDHHTTDEVVSQLQRATGYIIDKCSEIMLEAHTRGRAIAYTGTLAECERAAGILRQIRLQVETDLF